MNLFKGSNMILECLFLITLIRSTRGIKCWSCDSPYLCTPPKVVSLDDFETNEWCCIKEAWWVPKDGGKPQIREIKKYNSDPNDSGMTTVGCKRSTEHDDGAKIKIARCCCDTDGCNKELNISALEGPDGFVDGGCLKDRAINVLVLMSSFLTLPHQISFLLLGGFVLLPHAKGSPTNMRALTEAESPKNLAAFIFSPTSGPILYAATNMTTGSIEKGYGILSKELLNLVVNEDMDEPKGKIVHILTSSVTNEYKRNKGIFSPMMQCPEDWFVTEVMSAVEEDNTEPGGSGLNQVTVKCSSRTDENQFKWLETKLSKFDKEYKKDDRTFIYGQGPVKCPGGSFAIGFGLKSDMKDDGGATAFGIHCSHQKNFRRDLPGSRKGEWIQPDFMCPKESAICGIRLQIEPTEKLSKTSWWQKLWETIKSFFVKSKDYKGAGLTNVQMPCCEVNQRCTPHDGWEVLASYDNTKSAEPFHNKFTKTSGTSSYEHDSKSGYSESEKTEETEHKVHAEASAGIPGKASASISYDFKNNVKTSEKTGFNWANVAEHTFNEMTKHEYSYRVAPFVNMTLEQVVGTCGHTKVYTDQLRRTDTDKNGKPVVQNYTAYDGAQRVFDVNVRIAFGLLSILLI